MKRVLKWLVAIVVITLLGLGLMRALQAKKTQSEAANALANRPLLASIELAPSDLVQLKTRELAQGLAISGSLKAVNSAILKARVAGELRDLRVREGDSVKAGQIVARIDPTDIEWRIKQAHDQADAAKTQIDIAQRQFDNNKSLVDQGFISKTALDTSSSSLLGAQATHRAALASVELAKRSLDDTYLRSPIAGLVSQRLAQPGERVAIDGRVLEVVDLSRLELEATLAAADSVLLKRGQTATLEIEGIAQPVTAQVVRINPSAQAGSRSVLAYLAINNAGGLRQGLFAQGVVGMAKQTVLALPVSAVRIDKPSPYVQIVVAGKVVHQALILGNRGDADGEPMVAVTGLPDGAAVIRGAIGQLREGTPVQMGGAPAAGTKAAVSDNSAKR